MNKSFDILAKFLPNYDDTVPFSKIEIIQKSILLIKELQQKLKELLAENHKDILSKYRCCVHIFDITFDATNLAKLVVL